MARGRNFWVGAASVMLTFGGGGAAGAASTLIIHVDDRVSIPARELTVAKTVVERTFKAAGVEVIWTNTSVLNATPVTLILANIDDRAPDTNLCALGSAIRSRSVAYAFYNRIVEVTKRWPADVRVVLGRVIAHEIGHLLLPANSHSRYGIMRADLDVGYSNPDQFTKEQAAIIRTRTASAVSGK